MCTSQGSACLFQSLLVNPELMSGIDSIVLLSPAFMFPNAPRRMTKSDLKEILIALKRLSVRILLVDNEFGLWHYSRANKEYSRDTGDGLRSVRAYCNDETDLNSGNIMLRCSDHSFDFIDGHSPEWDARGDETKMEIINLSSGEIIVGAPTGGGQALRVPRGRIAIGPDGVAITWPVKPRPDASDASGAHRQICFHRAAPILHLVVYGWLKYTIIQSKICKKIERLEEIKEKLESRMYNIMTCIRNWCVSTSDDEIHLRYRELMDVEKLVNIEMYFETDEV